MTPTDPIRALIEALAADLDRCAQACAQYGHDAPDLPALLGALGVTESDHDDHMMTAAATALRALIPTRDPRVDPRAGDVLGIGGRPAIAVVGASDGPDPLVWSVRLREDERVGTETLTSWRDWSPYGGFDAVHVLYVAPEVSDG